MNAGLMFSSNSGGTWVTVANRTALFQVNGDVAVMGGVPEPATIALVFGGLSVFVLVRRRR